MRIGNPLFLSKRATVMKKTMYCVCFMVLWACSNEEPLPFEPQVLVPTFIGQGNLYGAGIENIYATNTVITDTTAWEALLLQMNTHNNVSNAFTTTSIDFSAVLVVAVFDHIHSTGGWSIDITGIMEQETEIIVTVAQLATGDATLVITQPFHIVTIPKSNKPVLFE